MYCTMEYNLATYPIKHPRVISQLSTQCLHDAPRRKLGPAVGHQVRLALQTSHRGHGDDVAVVALLHGAQERLDHLGIHT